MKRNVIYDTRLYSKESIITAVKSFSSDFKISILATLGNKCVVHFASDSDLDAVIGEFNNYLIYLENK